jgi:hypothetical protein
MLPTIVAVLLVLVCSFGVVNAWQGYRLAKRQLERQERLVQLFQELLAAEAESNEHLKRLTHYLSVFRG